MLLSATLSLVFFVYVFILAAINISPPLSKVFPIQKTLTKRQTLLVTAFQRFLFFNYSIFYYLSCR